MKLFLCYKTINNDAFETAAFSGCVQEQLAIKELKKTQMVKKEKEIK